MISAQTRAILWAQWRSLVNFGFRRSGVGSLFTGLFMLIWYGIWAFSAWALALFRMGQARMDQAIPALARNRSAPPPRTIPQCAARPVPR